MDLRDYLRTLEPEQRDRYAEACKTSFAYLQQIAGGHSTPSPKLAKRLSANSGGQVALSKLRPDIWTPDEAA